MEFLIKDNKNDKIISSASSIGELSDGYHTFNELYDFRREYNAALVNTGVWKAHKSYNLRTMEQIILFKTIDLKIEYFRSFLRFSSVQSLTCV